MAGRAEADAAAGADEDGVMHTRRPAHAHACRPTAQLTLLQTRVAFRCGIQARDSQGPMIPPHTLIERSITDQGIFGKYRKWEVY
jgi:hypothetical protein